MAQKPALPDGTWSVTKEDKGEIVAFGRALNKFIFDYVKDRKTFHAKIVAGGFQYFMDLQKQKSQIIGDDIIICQETLETYDLGKKIDEPFTDIDPIEEPKPAPAVDADIEDASIAPSNVPVTVDPVKKEEEAK